MKPLLLVAVLIALTVGAQPPPVENLPAANPSDVAAPVAGVTQVSTTAKFTRNPPIVFSGAVVEATRSNPFQLINPRAPRRFGDGYDNVSIDPWTGRAQGIRLFTISF